MLYINPAINESVIQLERESERRNFDMFLKIRSTFTNGIRRVSFQSSYSQQK